jgi:hypothetical protein
VRSAIGAYRRCADRLALDVADQHRQHLVAHGAVDAFDEFRFEGTGADLDQRVQVGRFVAAQAGRQQRRDGLRALAGQQRHAQQGHALAVAAQHGRALPVQAQRRHGLVDLADLVQAPSTDGPGDRRPGQIRRDDVAARRQLADQAVRAQSIEIERQVVFIGAFAQRQQMLVDAPPAHRLAGQGQQGQDQLALFTARVKNRAEDLRIHQLSHPGRFSISTSGRSIGAGMPNTRR